ncbi:MAG: 5-guanidino-2-oxopentanoate decarboxylase [Chloroflexota bacterium]
MILGEALVKLLEKYEVDTVFGIPGVHTLDAYRELPASGIRHITVRHEQGAGFAADGYARVTGKPGVCLLISGPGLLNAATPIGQAFADSIPMLVISSDNYLDSLGKGYGLLHEVTDLTAVTDPITAFSKTITKPDELPAVFAAAFDIFESKRPRPVHISIPMDVLAAEVSVELFSSLDIIRPSVKKAPASKEIKAAVDLLINADSPLILVGGGGVEAGEPLQALAEWLPAAVITTNNGKGVVSDRHPLNLGGMTSRPAAQAFVKEADVVLVMGSELSETDSYIDNYQFTGKIIRVDIDREQFTKLYETTVGIEADARLAAEALLDAVRTQSAKSDFESLASALEKVRERAHQEVSVAESKHIAIVNAIQSELPSHHVGIGDMTQISYTATGFWQSDEARRWQYAAGFCTLGCALPMGIGAKLADPDLAVVVMIGDAGFQFTLSEIATAVEQKISMPIVIWNNAGLGAIREHMDERGITRMAVDYGEGNPDFVALAQAYGCVGIRPKNLNEFKAAVRSGLEGDRPVLIDVVEELPWEAM